MFPTILVSSTSGQLWGFNAGAQTLRTVSPALTGGLAAQTDLISPFTIFKYFGLFTSKYLFHRSTMIDERFFFRN
jgi:hypothetical protein